MKTDTILQAGIILLIIGLILGGCHMAKADALDNLRPKKLGIRTDKGYAVITLATGEVKWGTMVPSKAVQEVLDQVVLTSADAKADPVAAKAAGYSKDKAVADWNRVIAAIQKGEKPAGGTDEEIALLWWKSAKFLFTGPPK